MVRESCVTTAEDWLTRGIIRRPSKLEDPRQKPHFEESGKIEGQNMKFAIRPLGVALLALVCWSVVASAQTPFTAGTWTKITKVPPAGVGHIQLLTDGSVLAL